MALQRLGECGKESTTCTFVQPMFYALTHIKRTQDKSSEMAALMMVEQSMRHQVTHTQSYTHTLLYSNTGNCLTDWATLSLSPFTHTP